jgi:acetyltransferase-like isoleucine patch superfamily enzyme
MTIRRCRTNTIPQGILPGDCVVESYYFIGANTTVLDEVVVANDTLIGAGATVSKDANEFELYITIAAEPAALRTDQIRSVVARTPRSDLGVKKSKKRSQ